VTRAHPTPAALDQLAAGTLADPAAQRAIARHLLRRCTVCTGYLRGATERARADRRRSPLAPPAPKGRLEVESYAEIVTHSLARSAGRRAAIAGDAVHVTACWNLLAGTPPSRRLALVCADPRFHQWALAVRLVETAADTAAGSPTAAREWCRLALAVAYRLPAQRYPASLVSDLRARARGRLADALRLEGRYAVARRAIAQAWLELEEGSGDPLERASLLCLEANLELTLGDFGAAARLLRPAAAVYRLYRQPGEEGRALYHLALALGYEDPQRGAATARRALARIDAAAEPNLDLAARHALIWFLNDGGEERRALRLLGDARPLYRRLGESDPDKLLPWLEARICRRLGEVAAAERGLTAVWHSFRGAGLRQELALVSLDLAEAFLAQGKRRHALRLLTTFQATLVHWRMHSEGLAAWLLLVRLVREAAAETSRAQALTQHAALYFRRAWRRRLPFRY
jgi:tetratricopeptide (TPR) repeat protein